MFNPEDINQYTNMNNSVSVDSNSYHNDTIDNKINRATLEQKLAIVLFFNQHKSEMPRFKLVNMLNKKISISISSLSSWLKKEESLKEKYFNISNTPIDSFDFNQIIQDILNSEDNESLSDNTNMSDRHNSISLNHININKKDNPRSKYIKINKMMDDLVIDRKQKQLPITESILKTYWVKFFPLCDIKDSKRAKGPSNGWLDNFKNKHELKSYGSSDYNFTFENVKLEENKVMKKNTKIKKEKKLPITNAISSEKILQNSPSSKLMYDHEDSAISHQSGLYITKPITNKYPDMSSMSRFNNTIYDERMNLKPQNMSMTRSEKNNLGDHSVPLTATASLNTGPQDITVNTRNTINNMQSRIMASQTDLLNALKPPQQESTDSFFKKFGSGIFNFNNASSKDLENVNAFFQQQKQNQSTSNNDSIKKNDSTSILSWFKNTAFQPQQKLPSTGMSFLNLSQYNKRDEVASSGVDSENLSNREHTLYSEVEVSNKNNDNEQNFLRNQVIKSEPILNKKDNKRLSKILSGETFKDNLKNKSGKNDYMSDDSEDSDGGLEINVPKNFTNEEVDVLLNVHVYNYLNKNHDKFGKSLEKFNEFMEVFQSEK